MEIYKQCSIVGDVGDHFNVIGVTSLQKTRESIPLHKFCHQMARLQLGVIITSKNCILFVIIMSGVANYLSEQKKTTNNELASEWTEIEELYNEK